MKRILISAIFLVFGCGGSTSAPEDAAGDDAYFSEHLFDSSDSYEESLSDEFSLPDDSTVFADEAVYDIQETKDVQIDTFKETAQEVVDVPVDIPPPQDVVVEEVLDPAVEACIYVISHLCDKMLAACNEQLLFGIIPDTWMQSCDKFVKDYESLEAQACGLLTQPSSDPTIELIKTMGPLALKSCSDNFKCDYETLGKIVDVVIPLVTGQQQADVMSLLNLIVTLCFEQ